MLRRQTSRHTNLIIRSRLTHKHSGVTLVHTSFGRIHPDTSLIALLSFKTHYLHETLFLSSAALKRSRLKVLLVSGSDAAPAPVHRHRPPLIKRFLGRLQQDGQAAVGHLPLLHRAHQLHRKQNTVCTESGRAVGTVLYRR